MIDTAGAEALIVSLGAVPTSADGEYRGALAAWMRRDWAPRLLPGANWEARVITSVSGRSGAGDNPTLVFEGEPYSVDLAYAEQQRIGMVRRKQSGHTLDIAMTLQDAAERLQHRGRVSIDAGRCHGGRIRFGGSAHRSQAGFRNPRDLATLSGEGIHGRRRQHLGERTRHQIPR